jgi:catechol 2,3-dioxygenase-like lactoylglutathione lyase family enzyme
MEPRISILTLGVESLERSIGFYRDGLGLPKQEGPADIAFFEMSGALLALYPREALAADARVAAPGSGFRSFTIAHNVRSRDEVDALLGIAVAAGATLVKPAEEASWGGYSGYFADPDGFLWEVAWNPHLPIG